MRDHGNVRRSFGSWAVGDCVATSSWRTCQRLSASSASEGGRIVVVTLPRALKTMEPQDALSRTSGTNPTLTPITLAAAVTKRPIHKSRTRASNVWRDALDDVGDYELQVELAVNSVGRRTYAYPRFLERGES